VDLKVYVPISTDETANAFRDAKPKCLLDTSVEQIYDRLFGDVLDAWSNKHPLHNYYIVVDPIDNTPV
jgi:hypothetical protein